MNTKKLVVVMFFALTFASAVFAAIIDPVTIATFADPSKDSSKPLFSVDFLNGLLVGGWDDSNVGLALEIPYNGHVFYDAWFIMPAVSIDLAGNTGSGTISFFANNTSTNPLLKIDFTSGYVNRFGFGGDEWFIGNNVTISGSEILLPLSEEQFSFSFANKKKLPGAAGLFGGFSATSAFTSSAIPEPATIGILGAGILGLLYKKR